MCWLLSVLFLLKACSAASARDSIQMLNAPIEQRQRVEPVERCIGLFSDPNHADTTDEYEYRWEKMDAKQRN